jgi:hypothetical protein
MFTAKESLQGQPLSSFGATACQDGDRLNIESTPGRRTAADAGRPVVRW